MLPWLDIETTGLDRKNDRILEIGVIVTDDDLQEVFRHAIVCRWLGDREKLHPYVRAMHEKSGLLDACEKSEDTVATAERDLIRLFVEAGITGMPLCGSSIHFDRSFLAEQMPELLKVFGYRSIDVSTLTELAKRWAPMVYESRPGGNLAKEELPHRSLADLEFSIACLKHYRYQFLDNFGVGAVVP